MGQRTISSVRQFVATKGEIATASASNKTYAQRSEVLCRVRAKDASLRRLICKFRASALRLICLSKASYANRIAFLCQAMASRGRFFRVLDVFKWSGLRGELATCERFLNRVASMERSWHYDELIRYRDGLAVSVHRHSSEFQVFFSRINAGGELTVSVHGRAASRFALLYERESHDHYSAYKRWCVQAVSEMFRVHSNRRVYRSFLRENFLRVGERFSIRVRGLIMGGRVVDLFLGVIRRVLGFNIASFSHGVCVLEAKIFYVRTRGRGRWWRDNCSRSSGGLFASEPFCEVERQREFFVRVFKGRVCWCDWVVILDLYQWI